MKVVILPCVGTNWAMAEIEDGALPIKIKSPRKLDKGEIELLLCRLYRDVCTYRWNLDHFKHLAYIAPFWALASGVVAYLRFANLWSVNPAFLIAYGWTTAWLAMDGVWCLLQVLTKIPQWRHTRKAFKSLKEPWTAKVVRDGWLAAIEDVLEKPNLHGYDKEREWIERLSTDQEYGHLYTRLLKRHPPRVMDYAPVGIWRYLKLMMLGVPVREPWLAWPMEK